MRQGEVWLINFNPTIGQEINKVRPAIIVSNDSLGRLKLKVVVLITEPQNQLLSWHVQLIPNDINGLSKSCTADCFQIKSISEQRMIRKLGVLGTEELSDIKITLAKVLSIY